jgi:hypothetical protein
MITGVQSSKATELTVLYNGRTAEFHYGAQETVKTLLAYRLALDSKRPLRQSPHPGRPARCELSSALRAA